MPIAPPVLVRFAVESRDRKCDQFVKEFAFAPIRARNGQGPSPTSARCRLLISPGGCAGARTGRAASWLVHSAVTRRRRADQPVMHLFAHLWRNHLQHSGVGQRGFDGVNHRSKLTMHQRRDGFAEVARDSAARPGGGEAGGGRGDHPRGGREGDLRRSAHLVRRRPCALGCTGGGFGATIRLLWHDDLFSIEFRV